jgi:hypothetical protein
VQTVSNIQDKAHLNSLWNLNVEHRKGLVESTSRKGCAHEGLAKTPGLQLDGLVHQNIQARGRPGGYVLLECPGYS